MSDILKNHQLFFNNIKLPPHGLALLEKLTILQLIINSPYLIKHDGSTTMFPTAHHVLSQVKIIHALLPHTCHAPCPSQPAFDHPGVSVIHNFLQSPTTSS
jgi:hypothetical protein